MKSGETRRLAARRFRVGDTGQRIDLLRDVAPEVREIVHLPLVNEVGLLRLLRLDERLGLAANFDDITERADLQVNVKSCALTDGELKVFHHLTAESRRFDSDLVVAR